MVNDILPASIIRDNPDIEYKPFLEYLEGDDIHSNESKNEMKSFLCHNVMYNDEIVEVNDRIVKIPEKPILETVNFAFNSFDTGLFKIYNSIKSYFLKIRFSYDDLYHIDGSSDKFNSFNSRIFTTKGSDYQIIPIVYKDFYSDIDIEHMLNDYSSFSTIIDYTKGIVYMNDVLLNHMKMNRKSKYDVLCNILVNREKIRWNDDVYRSEIQNENGVKLLDLIRNDVSETEEFKLEYIPGNGVYSRVTNPSEFVTEDEKYMMTINNVPYEIYKDFSSVINGTLYHNSEFGYFSEDKNRTAINVLAYDIAKNGLRKPIVINKFNGRFIVQSKTRFLIAQYLKLPEIPVVFYTFIGCKKPEISSLNVLERSQYAKNKITHDIRKILLPNVPHESVDEVKVQ